MLSSRLVLIHLNVLHSRSLSVSSSLSGTVVGIVCELIRFTYTYHLLFGKSRESDDDSFRLYSFELLEVDVANSFVPQIQVSFDYEAFCKHSQLHLILLEDEHLAFSSTVRYWFAFFLNKAHIIIESYLHALFDNLAD